MPASGPAKQSYSSGGWKDRRQEAGRMAGGWKEARPGSTSWLPRIVSCLTGLFLVPGKKEVLAGAFSLKGQGR